MKIFHCADLHLDAPTDNRLDPERAGIRRDELLLTFQRFLNTAAEEDADAVLLCGDLFDRDRVSPTAAAVVRDAILAHPGLPVYYLRGNHDRGEALRSMAGEEIPNLHTFGNSWTSYTLASCSPPVAITGAEITPPPPGGTAALLSSLSLSPDVLNIVILHGQVTAGSGSGGSTNTDLAPEEIPLNLLRNHNIDLLALGHIHAPQEGQLDRRGVYVYAGCLEGRGFDECGPRGYWVYTWEEDSSQGTSGQQGADRQGVGGLQGTPGHQSALRREFRPFAHRTLYDLPVPAEGCVSSYDLAERIRHALAQSEASTDDLLRLRLTGPFPADGEKNLTYLRHSFEGLFFYLEILDETTDAVDYEEYQYDPTFAGCFVRTVRDRQDLTEEEKGHIVRTGLAALRGEVPL